MTRSRRYLNNLPNVEKVKKLARDILDSELQLDKAISTNEKIKKEILKLESSGTSHETIDNPEKLENREQLEKLSGDLAANDKEINDLKRHIFDSQSIVDEEIREGLSMLHHKAISRLEEAQKDIIKHQKLADVAQKNLNKASGDDIEKYRHQWILNTEKIIKDEEIAKKCEKQIEAIKRVYKLEFASK